MVSVPAFFWYSIHMQKLHDYTGTWRCVYWFPSNKQVGDEPSSYEMQAKWVGNTAVMESVGSDAEGAYMFVRLTIDEETGVATGNWYETTSPSGEFKGAQYSGAGQLVVDPETLHMEGKWAGAGYNRKLGRMRIYTGNWEITPLEKV